MNTTVRKFEVSKIFQRSWRQSLMLHLFAQKYSKNSNIVGGGGGGYN